MLTPPRKGQKQDYQCQQNAGKKLVVPDPKVVTRGLKPAITPVDRAYAGQVVEFKEQCRGCRQQEVEVQTYCCRPQAPSFGWNP